MSCSRNFTQDFLYGDNTDGILSFLSEKHLSSKEKSAFEILIREHIHNTVNKKQCQLPDIGKEFQWLNTTRPLSLKDDFGRKVYVIDFFTYCCINCVHILPYLRELENKYANNPGFAVIGVHSAKFPNEKQIKQVEEAVHRHDIQHPVLNDPHCVLWKTFDIVCWPTVFIVGPEKNLLFVLIGERQIEKLEFLCDQVLKYFETRFELDPCVLPISLTRKSEWLELLYPGNVSANLKGHLLVSDTGHHRLILMSSSLETIEIIGSGIVGCDDGSFATATFNSPHGTAWWGDNCAFVADTGNHSIRKISFSAKKVSTVYKEDTFYETNKFRSPWDVCIGFKLADAQFTEVLYIAVAGSHQIWALNLKEYEDGAKNYCVPFAGSGKEENRPNRFRFKAGFAQPSGITCDNHELFVADAESSTIKAISLTSGEVRNIAGGGLNPTDLFKFGDQDGKKREVKLQHPMGICCLNSHTLVIADTYNHKLKLVDVTSGCCQTVKVIKEFNEPSGLCILSDTLFVVDTNNHRIVTIPVNELFSDIIPQFFDQEFVSTNLTSEDPPDTFIYMQENAQIFCHFSFLSNEKYVLNETAPQKLDVLFKGVKLDVLQRTEFIFGDRQPSVILKNFQDPNRSSKMSNQIVFIVSLPLCDKERNICCFKKVVFKILVSNAAADDGPRTIQLKLNLTDECKLSE